MLGLTSIFGKRRAKKDFRNLLDLHPLPEEPQIQTALSGFERALVSELTMSQITSLMNELPDDSQLSKIVAFGRRMGVDEEKLKKHQNHYATERDKKRFRQWMENNVVSLIEPPQDSSKEKHAEMLQIQSEIGLEEEEISKIKTETTKDYLCKVIEEFLDDEMFSPDEESRWERVLSRTKKIDIRADLDSELRDALATARVNWKLSKGPLEDIPVLSDVRIPTVRGEICYTVFECTRSERRTVSKRLRYAGPTARIRIAKGIYFRAGDIAFAPVREEHVVPQDTGTLYLTNKKLLFSGQKKGVKIPLKKIVSFEPYSDGLEVFKETGRNQIFIGDFNDAFFTLLNRLIDES